MAENTEYGIVPSFKPEEYVWIKKRLYIDTSAIDDEIICMPELIQQTGEYTSTAIEIRETAENELKHTIAHVAEYLRISPTTKGKTRSETQIQSEIGLSDEVKTKQEALSTARLDAALWSVLVDSLRKKDSGIRVIADLLNSGFLTASSIRDKRRKEIRGAKV